MFAEPCLIRMQPLLEPGGQGRSRRDKYPSLSLILPSHLLLVPPIGQTEGKPDDAI